MPIITLTEAASVIPEPFMIDVLDYMRDRLVLANLVRRNVRDQPGQKGQTIQIPKLGDLEAVDKVEKTDMSWQDPSNDSVDVVLNEHKVVPWAMEDTVAAMALDEALDYSMQAIGRLAAKIEDSLAGTYTDATKEAGAAGQAITTATLLDVWEKLELANVPDDGTRFAAIAVKDAKNLLDTDKLTKANEAGDGGLALRRSNLGEIHTLNIYKSNRIVKTTGPDTYHGLAGHRDGMTLAMRYLPLPPANSVAAASIMVDPETGLAFRMISSYGHAQLGVRHSLDVLFGTKMHDPRQMVEILS